MQTSFQVGAEPVLMDEPDGPSAGDRPEAATGQSAGEGSTGTEPTPTDAK